MRMHPLEIAPADRPGRVGPVYATKAVSEIERAHAQRIHGMTAWHPTRQSRVSSNHRRCRRPRRIELPVRDDGDALPTVSLARYGDRITDRLTRSGHVVQLTVPEADDDLARSELRSEAHELPAAAANVAATAPIPGQLRRCRLRPETTRRRRRRSCGAAIPSLPPAAGAR